MRFSLSDARLRRGALRAFVRPAALIATVAGLSITTQAVNKHPSAAAPRMKTTPQQRVAVPACHAGVRAWVLPEQPREGQPLEVVFVSDKPLQERHTSEEPVDESRQPEHDANDPTAGEDQYQNQNQNQAPNQAHGQSDSVAKRGRPAPQGPSAHLVWRRSNKHAIEELEVAAEARGGPPFSLRGRLEAATRGRHTIRLVVAGKEIGCARITVSSAKAVRRVRKQTGSFWQAKRDWTPAYEDLFSVWVEALFDAPAHEELSFRPLTQALRDRRRNFLFNHLGLREDDPQNRWAVPAAPDCADLPYYLRAYFAWKFELPFAFRACDRGKADRAPRCGELTTNAAPTKHRDPLRAFRAFDRLLRNTVHSGALRTALDDENTDFYPVRLNRKALRPGTVFADPYGHVLVVARWFDQTAERPGLLYAVDGQPDTSIGRKRFWEGNFLFSGELENVGAGFKTFRPLKRAKPASPNQAAGGQAELVPATNEALAQAPRSQRLSVAQAEITTEDFYSRIAKIINPRGIDISRAYDETLDALVEQLEARVRSVDNGERYMRSVDFEQMQMPEGPEIFETVGPWEDYATPSRDMRLLIAMKVLDELPSKVTRRPELFSLKGQDPNAVRAALQARHAEKSAQRFIEYVRSNGEAQKVSVAEIFKRRAALEMAYNPNDCTETRWGAPLGSEEHSTCKRKAPDDQRRKMLAYRNWFTKAQRPTRR